MAADPTQREPECSASALRDRAAENYEATRSILHSIRESEFDGTTETGRRVWEVAADVVLTPMADAAVARRIAAGLGARRRAILRACGWLRRWRSRQAFARATKADVLAAWENAFTAVFSCVNDIDEEPLDGADVDDSRRIEAMANLAARIEQWPGRAAALRRA